LILSILSSGKYGTFFNENELTDLEKVYSSYLALTKGKYTQDKQVELEFRISKKQNISSNFEYLLDYINKNYQATKKWTIDLIKVLSPEERNMYSDIIPNTRTTYTYSGDGIPGSEYSLRNYVISSNQVKTKIKDSTLKKSPSKFYNDFGMKLVLSTEETTKEIIKDHYVLSGKKYNNLIRFKERYSVNVGDWIIDLTKVKETYSVDDFVNGKMFENKWKYEIEGEYSPKLELIFLDFINSLNKIYIEILSHVNYCK
jgi:hypothetical protein